MKTASCHFLLMFHLFVLYVQLCKLTLNMIWANSADDKLMICFLIFPRKHDLTFHAYCLQFAWNLILFSGKNKKNISKCCLLKILPRVLSVNKATLFWKLLYIISAVYSDFSCSVCKLISLNYFEISKTNTCILYKQKNLKEYRHVQYVNLISLNYFEMSKTNTCISTNKRPKKNTVMFSMSINKPKFWNIENYYMHSLQTKEPIRIWLTQFSGVFRSARRFYVLSKNCISVFYLKTHCQYIDITIISNKPNICYCCIKAFLISTLWNCSSETNPVPSSRRRWPTSDQAVTVSIPAGSGNILLWNIFYGHSLPSTDSRRAVFSFWRKNVHKYWLTT